MSHTRIAGALMALGVLSTAGFAQPASPVSDAVRIAQASNSTLGLIAGGPGSTDARVAAEIARVVDDDDKLRVLPMQGRGSEQNIADLIYLKGVDLAIVHADVLSQTMQRGSIPREASVQYICKLFQEEVHILARKDIVGLGDLAGKLVSVGLHFLPVPLTTQVIDTYLPTSLDRQHYPNLVPAGPPVDTVAVGSILITLSTAADTQRAKRVNRFVDTLFERFDQFRKPGFHPKWREVNLAAQVPGWARYPEVLALLRNNQQGDTGLRTSFDSYLNQSGQSTAGMNNERREALFRDFLRWRDQHSGP